MDIKRPIFIIGVGRSGSTIFFDVLSRHPDLVWLSKRLCNNYPDRPEFNRALMDCIRLPYIGKLARRLFEPGECYGYWDNLYRGFSSSYRNLDSHDVTEKARKKVISSLSAMVKKPNDRLVVKITGWNRIHFLNEIFPDALFIHVERDPRAVINSFLDVYFWPGWKGPQGLLMNNLSDEQKDELDKFNNSFVALAGMKLEELNQAYIEAKNNLSPDKLHEISYESLCSDPMSIYKDACEFCGIEWNKGIMDAVQENQFKNTNFKWQKDLSKEQCEIVQYYYEKIKGK